MPLFLCGSERVKNVLGRVNAKEPGVCLTEVHLVPYPGAKARKPARQAKLFLRARSEKQKNFAIE